MRALFLFLVCAVEAAAAQVQSRPTDPPLVTAVNESWYRLGEPIQFAGELYYPAGPVIFFNGNTMIRTGHYNGVPLYADTTVEPFSIVLVPPVVIARRPESNDGIWIEFKGARWIHAGPAVPLTDADFIRVGDHAGFPVYARRGARDIIYLPTRDGSRAAPYRLKR